MEQKRHQRRICSRFSNTSSYLHNVRSVFQNKYRSNFQSTHGVLQGKPPTLLTAFGQCKPPTPCRRLQGGLLGLEPPETPPETLRGTHHQEASSAPKPCSKHIGNSSSKRLGRAAQDPLLPPQGCPTPHSPTQVTTSRAFYKSALRSTPPFLPISQTWCLKHR